MVVLLAVMGLRGVVWAGGQESAETPAAIDEKSVRSPSTDVVAIVNGEALYIEDIASVLGEIHGSAAPQQRSRFDIDQMLFRLVNDTLLAQEARTLGMDRDDEIRAKVAGLRERLARRRLEKEEIYSRIEVDPERLDSLYEEIFRTATLRVVTRKDRKEAQALLEEIERGADIAELAREQSQDPYSMRGGLMKGVARLDIAADFAEIIFSSEPGQVGGPVATSSGWTVFRVEAIEPADPQQYERRKGEVQKVLRLQQRDALRSDLLARLREKHEVVLEEDVYKSIVAEALPDGRLLPRIENPDAVVVEAGGRVITSAKFGKALAARWDSIASPEVANKIKPVLLDNMTVDELIAAEALSRGYHETAEVDREAHALETRLLVTQYLREVLTPQTEASKDEIEAYFEEHRDEFRRPPRLYVSQLTVATREEAEDLADLVRGGAEFAWLARRHSQDEYRDGGGSVGWVLASEGVRGFEAELATAEPGEVFGPKGAEDSWKLVHVGVVEDQGFYSLNEVSGNVRRRVESQKFIGLIDTYIGRLRERSEIVIDEEAVNALRIEADAQENAGGQRAPGHSG
jgi:peptidyl-prolyl cis-trans isomerase C